MAGPIIYRIAVLLFVAGVINLLWVAVIAVIVLLEKVAPGGRLVSRVLALLFMAWRGWLLSGALG